MGAEGPSFGQTDCMMPKLEETYVQAPEAEASRQRMPGETSEAYTRQELNRVKQKNWNGLCEARFHQTHER